MNLSGEALAIILTAITTAATQLAAMRMDANRTRVAQLQADLDRAERDADEARERYEAEVARLRDEVGRACAEADRWQEKWLEAASRREN